jgi:hypothetical protein
MVPLSFNARFNATEGKLGSPERLRTEQNRTVVSAGRLDFEVDAYSSSAPFPDAINMSLLRVRLSVAMSAIAEFNGSGNPKAVDSCFVSSLT